MLALALALALGLGLDLGLGLELHLIEARPGRGVTTRREGALRFAPEDRRWPGTEREMVSCCVIRYWPS